MFNRFLFLILFLSSGTFFAQQKYLVYFKDKGVVSQNRFDKPSQAVFQYVQYLSPKSIERRKKAMGEDSFINYDDVPVYKSYTQQIMQLGIKTDKTLNWFNAVSCFLDNDEYRQVKALPFVDKIEPVRLLGVKKEDTGVFDISLLFASPKDVLTNYLFEYGESLTQNLLSDVPKVHDAGFDGAGVIIGLLDSGFELTSQALAHVKILAQHDFIFNDDVTSNQISDAMDQHTHGTAVLSIMAGFDAGNMIGPAFNADILLAKVEDVRTEKHIEEDNYAAALEWMEAQGVQITSSSLGYGVFDAGETSYTYQNMDGKTTIVTKAAEKAFERGVVTITAAGNEGAKTWHYITAPGDGINTITVGAVNPDNSVAGFSSRGPTSDGRIKPDICAQGTSVYHSLPLSRVYESGSGTSYATPMTAGIAALLVQAYPHLNNVQVRSILLQSGDNIESPDNNRGYGLLSAVRAVNMPNLKKIDNVFVLNKMLIGEKDIVAGSVVFNYYRNSVLQSPINMTVNGANKYSVTLTQLSANDEIKFTILYNTPDGAKIAPVKEYYRFTYGDLLVYDKSYGAENQLPESLELYQNFPNPFTFETAIRFDLPKDEDVSVNVYNILGQSIRTLFAGNMYGGQRNIKWNGRNDNGIKCSSGVYIIVVKTKDQTSARKIVLVK